ncbi:phosphohistidine phosphatase SixA [Marinomonas balearica]|uniref:Phosphohistidine phosphatase SixA n=1 Tax=Marinomonas balearica TaxID=491947 RepID=A0A4R6ME27_9GAMM|nr:phosphohistidine phosphatase SixA [Marinomonas balearica]TDP00029.1 phosphohistidine phosphatase SixA [Marinomonas balearica]
MKKLYVMRHGNAEAYGYQNDAERNLTEIGRVEARQSAQQFLERVQQIDAVFVSPYVRAQQTAEEFLDVYEFNGPVSTEGGITPSGKELDVALWLHEQPYDSILLITHQPFAHQLVELLSQEALPANFGMTTATIAALEGELFATACCHFQWAIHPSNQ